MINKIENKEMTERERESNERGRTGGVGEMGRWLGGKKKGGSEESEKKIQTHRSSRLLSSI